MWCHNQDESQWVVCATKKKKLPKEVCNTVCNRTRRALTDVGGCPQLAVVVTMATVRVTAGVTVEMVVAGARSLSPHPLQTEKKNTHMLRCMVWRAFCSSSVAACSHSSVWSKGSPSRWAGH